MRSVTGKSSIAGKAYMSALNDMVLSMEYVNMNSILVDAVSETDWLTMMAKAVKEGASLRDSEIKMISKRICSRTKGAAHSRWANATCQRLIRASAFNEGQHYVRDRLKALRSLAVHDANGKPCIYMGRLVLETYTYLDASDMEFPVMVRLLGEDWYLSEFERYQAGIPIGAPCLLSDQEIMEIRLIKRVNRWAQKVGRLAKKFGARRDDREEEMVGPTPQSKSKEGKKLSDLVQYRVKTKEDERVLWAHMMLMEKSERFIETPLYSMKVVERKKVVLAKLPIQGPIEDTRVCTSFVMVPNFERLVPIQGPAMEPMPEMVWGYELGDALPTFGISDRHLEDDEFLGFEKRATGRDEQDPDTELHLGDFRDHEGYDGRVPLNDRSKNENALWSRDPYRLGDEIWLSNRSKKDGKFERVFGKQVMSKAGKWFASQDPWALRALFIGEDDAKIVYWEKRFAQSNTIQIVNPEFPEKNITDDREIERILRDPKLRYHTQLAWKGGHLVSRNGSLTMSVPDGVGELGREIDGMIMACIEDRSASGMVLEKTEHFDRDGLYEGCLRCEKKYFDTDRRKFTKMEHAWVCPICGNEVARVTGKVWIDLDLLEMVSIKERFPGEVTHVEVEIFGAWLGELIKVGAPIGRRFRVTKAGEGREIKQVHLQEGSVPSWVSDLTEPESKNSRVFWEMFKTEIFKREEIKNQETKELRYRLNQKISQREFFKAVYGPECLTPLEEKPLEFAMDDIAF